MLRPVHASSYDHMSCTKDGAWAYDSAVYGLLSVEGKLALLALLVEGASQTAATAQAIPSQWSRIDLDRSRPIRSIFGLS